MQSNIKIISVTGTKGKTTVVRAIDYVLTKCGENTLRVDTDGHYINGKQKSTLQDSKELFHIVPTVCPGKYLIDIKREHNKFTAILEASLGCSRLAGMGYALHDIGIFTNVYEDHLETSDRLKTRKDLVKAKEFIFKKIRLGGDIVFNADSKLICKALSSIPKRKKPTLIAVSLGTETKLKIKSFIKKGGVYVTIQDDFVVINTKEKTKKVVNINDINWTFNGTYKPSLYNLLFTIAGLYAYYKKNGQNLPEKAIEVLKIYTPDINGGRLTLFKNKSGVTIIIDYAHEIKSFIEIAKLGKKFIQKNGSLIGVLRIAPDRTNSVIKKTSKKIASSYDYFIIYDKIDGIKKSKYIAKYIKRTIGETSKIFTQSLQKYTNRNVVENIIIEDKAIKKASEIAKPGDVIIVISGQEHSKTINSVKEYFDAKIIE